MDHAPLLKTIITLFAFGIFALIVFGLFWFFAVGSAAPVGFGWYLFSFAAGITMIVLPCTLPLAFVIVPLSLGKRPGKGLGIALAFSAGIVLTLSFYGVIAALVGEVAVGTIGAPLEAVKNWLYVVAGLFAYLFALGSIGLIRFRMPTYTGAAPAFIQRRGDYLKALLLGLFLGNIGVGCPHPAIPVILTRIAVSGDVFYGWLLFLVHAIGRVLPLLLLAFLAILGVNALQWLVARKDRIERAAGWSMIFVGAFILVLGLFTHDWWVISGQHTLWEELTLEEQVVGIIAERLDLDAPHRHGLEEIAGKTGLLELPLWLGNWALVLLWIVPLWWYFFKNPKNNKITSLILLSVLLLITFAYYLPLRFERQAMPHEKRGIDMMIHGNAHGTIYHEEGDAREGLAVNLNVTPVPIFAGTTTRLDFFVNQKPGNIPITDLEIEHTKLMHVIGARNDLSEFFHIHPQFVPQAPYLFSAAHVFAKPGVYKLWSEIKREGVNHAFGHPEISVEGSGEKYKKEVFFGRSIIVGNYQVLLHHDEPIAKEKTISLHFEVRDLFGREAELEPHLGADMHLVIIKDDLTRFIHTHPVNDDLDGDHRGSMISSARAHGVEEKAADGARKEIAFNVTLPEAGLYKAFAQFRPAGIELAPDEALVASFWIQAEEESPFRISLSRGALAGISLILIFVLSRWVKRYLESGIMNQES